MRDFPHMAVWGVQVRAEAEGRVEPQGDRARITYTPSTRDMERFREGVKRLCEMHFAAGAVRVYPGVHSGPDELTSPDEIGSSTSFRSIRAHWSFIAAHLFGTCRMGPSGSSGVVGSSGAVHGVQRLWVVDASVIPGNLGVNPQHTIMALAMELSRRIA